jgi:hypothetical protein
VFLETHLPEVIYSLNTHWKVRGVLRNPLAKGNKLFGHTLEGGEEFLETLLPKVISSLDKHWKAMKNS